MIKDPEIEEEEEDEEDQGEEEYEEYEEYETSDEDDPPGLESGSDDEFTVPGCTKDDKEIIHNPTCVFHESGGCRDGAKCLFPHRTTEGVLAAQQVGKKLIAAEQKKAEEAAKNEDKPKPKAKAKAKAKGKAEK